VAKNQDRSTGDIYSEGGFVALEPEISTTRLAPRPVAPEMDLEVLQKNNRNQDWERRQAYFQTLPAENQEVRLLVLGGRVVLNPLGQQAALMLEGLRAQLGIFWDGRQQAYIARFDDLAAHGTNAFESLILLLEIGGVHVEVSPETQKVIERYQHRLKVQRVPITRTIWADENSGPEGELTSVTELDSKRRPKTSLY
jgi:hypothetical protein